MRQRRVTPDMVEDFAKIRPEPPLERRPAETPPAWLLLFTGLISGLVIGVFACFMLYLSGNYPPLQDSVPVNQVVTADAAPAVLVTTDTAIAEAVVAHNRETFEELSSRIDNAVSEFKNTESSLNNIYSQLDRQGLLLSSVTGEVIPLNYPENWIKSLTSLEQVLEQDSNWPRDIHSALDFHEKIATLIGSAPIWVETYYLDRLSRLRWVAEVFSHRYPQEEVLWEGLLEYMNEREYLLNESPYPPVEPINSWLEEELKALEDALPGTLRNGVVEFAAQALKTKPVNSDTLNIASGWLAEPAILIGADDAAQARRKELAEAVNNALLNNDAEEKALIISSRLEKVMQMDGELKLLGLISLANETGGILLKMELESIYNQEISEIYSRVSAEIGEATRREEAEYEAARLQYHQWALAQIFSFRKEWTVLVCKNEWFSACVDPFTADDEFYEAVKDAMISILFPIDENLLDSIVRDEYIKALGTGFDSLSPSAAESVLREALESSVRVKRRTLDAIDTAVSADAQ